MNQFLNCSNVNACAQAPQYENDTHLVIAPDGSDYTGPKTLSAADAQSSNKTAYALDRVSVRKQPSQKGTHENARTR